MCLTCRQSLKIDQVMTMCPLIQIALECGKYRGRILPVNALFDEVLLLSQLVRDRDGRGRGSSVGGGGAVVVATWGVVGAAAVAPSVVPAGPASVPRPSAPLP